MRYKITIDAGGTFTDGVLINEKGKITSAKAYTTPQYPAAGTMNCIGKLASESGMTLRDMLGQTGTIIHGTTLGTNAVASGSGAKMGTIATKGYRVRMTFPQVPKSDWKERPVDMYDFRLDAPTALTRNYLMTEVEERVNRRGEVMIPLNEESVRTAVRYLKKQQVESIAVMLMFSPLYPNHEQRIAEIIQEEYPGVYTVLSSAILPIIGEVERWSTTMFSAYIGPMVADYIPKLKAALEKEGFKGELLFIQSNGGVATPEIISENPALLLISGPASGPFLGLELGKTHEAKNILSVDMGGTSFDVGVIHEGIVDIVPQQVIDAKKYAIPSVDVTSVGAGGGSIAYVDPAGRLQVGPKSAGAFPGPACYGRGGEDPTVTDANVVLGYIDPDFFLGGESKLRKDLAEKAVKEKIADPLGLTVPEAAAAIYDVINERMASGTHVVFAKRGYDPRDFVLCAGGGAAPVHAVRLMEELGIRKLIVPKVAPIYCAFGLAFCDLKHDYQRSYLAETSKADLGKINELFGEMEKTAYDTLRREGVADKDVVIEKSMEVCYFGQFRQQVAKVPPGPVTKDSLQATINSFHRVHQGAVGYSDPNYPTEIVRLHLSGIARSLSRPQLKATNQRTNGDVSNALKGTRQTYFSGSGFTPTKVYDGDKLCVGNALTGPCIIEERFTTLVVPPRVTTTVDSGGNYITTLDYSSQAAAKKTMAADVIDPTTFSVVWNKIDYIVEQIGQRALRAVQTRITALVRDMGQTFLDTKGKIVSAASYLPIHTMVAEEAIKGIESYFHGEYEPGDFIVANDAYIVKGGHLPDWNFARPVFYKGEHIGFFQFKMHVSDTGGFMPGGYAPGAYDIIAEGLNVPPLKIIKKGVVQKELWGFLLRNVREPTQLDMDTMLVNGSMAKAEEEFGALCDKYGVETVKACMKEIVDSGERLMRAEIAKIADGTYYGESATDWDGTTDKPIWVRVDAIVKGDEITFDYSKSDPQATFVNAPAGVVWTCTMVALFYIVDASVPKNGGAMVPVHIIAPEGSVVNPIYPATCGASQIAVATQIVEACLSALSKAIPERAMASWTKHLCPIHMGVDPDTIDPRTGRPRQYIAETFASDAGSGAVKGFDGWHGVILAPAAANFRRPSMEVFETDVPYMVTVYDILKDWEGAGEFRGSPGVYTETVAYNNPAIPAFLQTGNSDGEKFAPSGVAGGGSPPCSEMHIMGVDGKNRVLRTISLEPIFPGETIITKCSGGGGWGNPLNRGVRKVQDDVLDGLVSLERARDVYGVVLDPETFEIQYEATEKLRKELKERAVV